MRTLTQERAFTLIELLVVVAIIGLISAVVIGSVTIARENARIAAGKKQDGYIYRSIGDQLVGAWNFDEVSGTATVDSSGNGNNGTYAGGAVRAALSPYSGTSLQNPGSVTISDVKGLSPSVVTVTAWVYVTANHDWHNFVSNNWGANGGWILFSNSQGTVSFGVYHAGAQRTAASVVNKLKINQWNFLVGTYDGSKAELFVDGQSVATNTYPGAPLTTTSPLIIGGAGPTKYIDQVRVYSSPLTVAQINALYALGPSL